jgi:hypothetical protein
MVRIFLFFLPPKVHPLVDDGESLTDQDRFDLNKEQTIGWLEIGRLNHRHMKGLPLQQSAAEIKDEFSMPVKFDAVLYLEVIEGAHFATRRFSLLWLQSKQKMTLEGWLLHILSELHCTEFP